MILLQFDDFFDKFLANYFITTCNFCTVQHSLLSSIENQSEFQSHLENQWQKPVDGSVTKLLFCSHQRIPALKTEQRIQISSFKIVQRVDHHLDLDYGNDKQLLRHYYIFGLVFTLSREGWEQKSEQKEPKALPLSPSLCLSFVSLTVFYGKFTRTLRNDLTQQQPFYFFFGIELEIYRETESQKNFSHCNKLRKNWNVIWFFPLRCHKD